jgi:hypothetical protein
MSDRSDEVREHVLDTLRTMRDWKLTPGEWADVSAVLDTMHANLDLTEAGQAARLDQAAFELEVLGPERLNLISTNSDEARSATDGVKDRAGWIVHVLNPPPEEGAGEDTRAAG